MKHLTTSELEAGLEEIVRSPKDDGVVEMIVRRPQVGERESLQRGQLDLRGINARVVRPGVLRVGNTVAKLSGGS